MVKTTKDICAKCSKRTTCKIPCYPIENYLRWDNKTVFEKNYRNKTVVYPLSREAPISTLSTGDDKAGNPRISSKEAIAFSTEAENPFHQYEANHKQTSVFIKRFFGRWPYKDIAAVHEISIDAARKLYYAGVKKLLAIIIEMDQVKKMTEKERKQAAVAKQKRYREKNRGKVNARRRAHYNRNKEKINAKRRAEYAKNKH
jgi:hypothetical protein